MTSSGNPKSIPYNYVLPATANPPVIPVSGLPIALSGVGNPSNILGANGDYYLDSSTGNIWGPKVDGLWPVSANYTPSGAGSLASLTDVQVTEGPSIDGYSLTWNNSAGKWEALDVSGGGGGPNWSVQQNFEANISLIPSTWIYFNGNSDTNWRMGLNLGNPYSTTQVGQTTSIQVVHGGGNDGPDGWAVGVTGGNSIIETVGCNETFYVTGSGGMVVENDLAVGGTINGFNLEQLDDVSVSEGSAINGYMLIWNNNDEAWEATAPTLAALHDVTLTSPSNGQILKYNGSKWVNSAESASGSAPLYDISAGVPALSSMTVANGGSYTVTTTESSGKAINLITSTDGSSNSLYGLTLPVPSSTPYRVRILLQWSNFGYSGGSSAAVAVGWMDASGKLMLMFFRADPEIFCAKFSSVSSYSSSYNTYAMEMWGPETWFGLYNDGTNVHLQISRDGVNFVTLASDTVSSGYLADYGKVFWGLSTSVSNVIMSLTLRCYDVNGLSATFPT